MPKKPAKNSFSIFLDEYVESERQKGRHISKAIGSEECARLWQSMAPEDKRYYEDQSKNVKARLKTDLTQKYTSDRKTFAEVQAQERKKEKEYADMINEIKDTVLNCSPETELPRKIFHIFHVNYYCRTSDGVYWPAEIAVSCFSLANGLVTVYHTLVDPGKLPTGYTYEAKLNSDEVHKLPLPPYEAGEADFLAIYENIVKKLEIDCARNEELPPLYALPTNVEAAVSMCKTMSELDTQKRPPIHVYPLDELYYLLRNVCASFAGVEGFPQKSLAKADLERDVFCYTPDISCGFHAEQDGREHKCSLSIVVRHAFLICDMCVKNLNIEIIPGYHVPKGSDVGRFSRMSSTATSFAPSTRYSSTIASSVCFDKFEDDDEEEDDCLSEVTGHSVQDYNDVRVRNTSKCMYEESDQRERALRKPGQPKSKLTSDNFPTLGGLNVSKNRKPK